MAGLCLEVAEGVHDRGADLFIAALVGGGTVGCAAVVAVVAGQTCRGSPRTVPLVEHLAQSGVEILLAVPELQDPGLVVDPRAAVADLLVGHTEGAGQHPSGALDAVAEADGAQALGVQECGGHRHGVRIVDELGLRAQLARVGRDLFIGSDRAEEAEHTTRAQGVADGLVDPVAARDLNVVPVGLHPAHLEGDDDDVGLAQGLAPVRGLLHRGAEPMMLHQLAGGVPHPGQTRGVDVHQREGGGTQSGEAEQVADQPKGEDEAAGSDDGDLGRVCDLCHIATVCPHDLGNLP